MESEMFKKPSRQQLPISPRDESASGDTIRGGLCLKCEPSAIFPLQVCRGTPSSEQQELQLSATIPLTFDKTSSSARQPASGGHSLKCESAAIFTRQVGQGTPSSGQHDLQASATNPPALPKVRSLCVRPTTASAMKSETSKKPSRLRRTRPPRDVAASGGKFKAPHEVGSKKPREEPKSYRHSSQLSLPNLGTAAANCQKPATTIEQTSVTAASPSEESSRVEAGWVATAPTECTNELIDPANRPFEAGVIRSTGRISPNSSANESPTTTCEVAPDMKETPSTQHRQLSSSCTNTEIVELCACTKSRVPGGTPDDEQGEHKHERGRASRSSTRLYKSNTSLLGCTM
mmetsp:Transcript_21180/g.59224  ORF Transcript_21180/g.59224 Transcript_21180/m.59224 type:complete len:347 (-) Transcript_21180:844-1884(-)